jgi:hypothetical protein
MDAFLKFMTADTTIFGIVFQNWMLTLAGILVLWALVLVRDL